MLYNFLPYFRLRPAVHSRTPVEAYSLKVKPENHFINCQQDPFGNCQARIVFPDRTRELQIDVEVIADLKVINLFDFFVEEYADKFPFEYEEQRAKERAPHLEINQGAERRHRHERRVVECRHRT